jgi:hypothetical protein
MMGAPSGQAAVLKVLGDPVEYWPPSKPLMECSHLIVKHMLLEDAEVFEAVAKCAKY